MDFYESTYANTRQPGPAPDMRADQHRLNTYYLAPSLPQAWPLICGLFLLNQKPQSIPFHSGLPCQRQQRLFQLVINHAGRGESDRIILQPRYVDLLACSYWIVSLSRYQPAPGWSDPERAEVVSVVTGLLYCYPI